MLISTYNPKGNGRASVWYTQILDGCDALSDQAPQERQNGDVPICSSLQYPKNDQRDGSEGTHQSNPSLTGMLIQN